MEFTFTIRQFEDEDERQRLVDGIIRHTNEEQEYILGWLGRVVWANQIASDINGIEFELTDDSPLKIDFVPIEERLQLELQRAIHAHEWSERFDTLFSGANEKLMALGKRILELRHEADESNTYPMALGLFIRVSSHRMQTGDELREFWLTPNPFLKGKSPFDCVLSPDSEDTDAVQVAILNYADPPTLEQSSN